MRRVSIANIPYEAMFGVPMKLSKFITQFSSVIWLITWSPRRFLEVLKNNNECTGNILGEGTDLFYG